MGKHPLDLRHRILWKSPCKYKCQLFASLFVSLLSEPQVCARPCVEYRMCVHLILYLPGRDGPLFQMRGSWLPEGILRWPSYFFCPLCSLSPGETALAGEATHKGCSQVWVRIRPREITVRIWNPLISHSLSIQEHTLEPPGWALGWVISHKLPWVYPGDCVEVASKELAVHPTSKGVLV